MPHGSSSQLARSIIKAQEDERLRVARELHDGPAQIMANVALRLDVCQKLIHREPQRVQAELQQLRDLLRIGLQDARKLIAGLRPMALDDVGLVPTLQDLVREAGADGGYATSFHVHGQEQPLDAAVAIALFRVCQEALHNIAKHARAETVRVELAFTTDEVTLSVSDDGVGFEADALPVLLQGTRFGLVGMRERASLLGGRFQLETAPGEGVTVVVTVPLTVPGGDEGA